MTPRGYTYGTPEVARSPVSVEDFEKLLKTAAFSEEDRQYLRKAAEVLRDQVNDILDLWYGFVGSQPHLLYYFTGSDGQPISEYLAAVRERFGQWILDTCERDYDQAWLDYQHEIALRHHRSKKNRTDGVQAPEHIPLRYVLALAAPIILTIKTFLAKKCASPEEVEKMHAAWTKSIVLQMALWSVPYTRDGEW